MRCILSFSICGSMAGRLLDRLRGYFRSYLESFERGRSRFGVWWIVFTGSLLFAALVFLVLALGLVFFVLPKMGGA